MHKKTHKRIAGRLAELRETSDSEVKRVEEVVQEAKAYAETLVETVREPLVVLDGDLRVISANRSFCQTFQISPEETKDHLIYELGNNQWDIPRLRVLLEEMLPRDTQVQDFEVDHEFPAIGRRAMVLNAHRLRRNGTGTPLILLAIEDITERQRAEETMHVLENFIESGFHSVRDGLIVFDRDFRIILWNKSMEEICGYVAEEVVGKVADVLPRFIEQGSDELFKIAMGGKVAERSNVPFKTPKGKAGYANEKYIPLQDQAGKVIGVVAVIEDVTEVFHLKQQVARFQEELAERKLVEFAKGILVRELGLSEDGSSQLIQKRCQDGTRTIEEVAGHVVEFFGSPEDQEEFRKRFP
jgi:PAS domain S-box-containing protein